ncbi:MAG: AmmeMemoRadiSam system protein B [Anaerolineae bacterium]|nr:AmmeMemoRadiSam system protein B [Anaerolineae bacterium]
MATISDVRPSPIAGRWYSGNRDVLAREVDEYIESAKIPDLNGEVIGIIAPHAGYIYSGPTAGYAFRSVRGLQRDLVVIVSPFHHLHRAPFLTTAHSAYATPLGAIAVDVQAQHSLNQYLSQEVGCELTPISHDQEHSLEIELPFLQRALQEGFRLLPIMARTHSPEALRALGKGIAHVAASGKTLLVASTDLSHQYPENIAQALDAEMLRRIERFDPQQVLEAESSGRGFACGVAAVAAVLWAARDMGADRVSILHHSTSARETGDYSNVVGYGAAAILKTR